MVAFVAVALSPESYARFDPTCIPNCLGDQTSVCMKSKLLEERVSNKLYEGLTTPEELCTKCCNQESSPTEGSVLSE